MGDHLRTFPFSWWRRCLLTSALLALLCASGLKAQQAWRIVGPDGGDARSFAAVPGHPNHLYLGTTNNWVYETLNGGASWHRWARLGNADGLILDHIIVDPADPSTIYVAGWWAGPQNGGLWVTHDAGRTWTEPAGLRGREIHAFAQAPSDPKVLYAGTLQGVFQSVDGGATWKQISPLGSREIHEIESLAVDPRTPDTVYVGTWHLPWKTTNGGKTWHSIKRGLIVDSDVFSIIVDPVHPRTVYLSACSGIYKSNTAGARFYKIQGIPSAARRTRAITQDPENRQIVYAGTTEGLYKTVNGGRTFRRMTPKNVVVNDVFVDPRNSNHVLLATDRSGVLVSNNGGDTFSQSNNGISERKVEALLVDRRDPRRIYAGIVNDKTYGGVFVSNNGGASWKHIQEGLNGSDVYALAQAKDGLVVAGTNQGIFVLDPPSGGNPAGIASGSSLIWERRDTIANTVMKTAVEIHYGTRVNVQHAVKQTPFPLQSRVNSLDVSGDVWVAGTNNGLLTSSDNGITWHGGPVMGEDDFVSVSTHGKIMAAAWPTGIVLSKDDGQTWWPVGTPKMLTRIHCIAFSPDGTLWVGAREGVYFTRNLGKTWLWFQRLPFRDVNDVYYDPATHRVLLSSRQSDQVFGLDPKHLTWKWWQTGYNVALIRPAGDRLVAASVGNGVLVEPSTAEAESARK